MPKLILSMDGLVLKEIVLVKGRTSIGRKPSNDIQIDNLAISGEHAVITTILDDAFLEDQNSTNGTYVNGQPIKKHVLHHNDVVELGKYRLKFIADGMQTAGASELIETAALKPLMARADVDEPMPSSRPRAAVASRVSAEPAAVRTQLLSPAAVEAAMGEAAPVLEAVGVIQLLSGANAGKELTLTKSLTTLGKPGRQVAVITKRPHGYFITHVEGATFPVVNGRSLDAQARLLKDHDIIEIAGVKMEFFFRH